MAKYRKKPVVIDAIQFVGDESRDEVKAFCPDARFRFVRCIIPTLEGEMAANPGDWIIKGVAGQSVLLSLQA